MRYICYLLVIASTSFQARADLKLEEFGDAMVATAQPSRFSRVEFNSAIRFSVEDIKGLYAEFSKNDSTREMVLFLAAVNCAFEPPRKSQHSRLFYYRCGAMSFDVFSEINLPHNYRVLRYVKEEDRQRAINYLEQYVSSFELADCEKSICISDVIIRKDRKLIEYLKQGGAEF